MVLRPVYFDTETTGTRPDKDRIIEIAAYDSHTGRSFERLINPQIPIPADATRVHNITDKMVQGAPTFSIIAKEFVEFCSGDVVLIAHNCDNFDKLFLQFEFARNNVEFPSNFRFLDSLKWARRYRRDLPRHSLQFLRQIYSIAENNAHRALDDVKVLQQVFEAMIDDLTIEEVCTLLQTSTTSEAPQANRIAQQAPQIMSLFS